MEGAYELLSFIARSSNRLTTLRALADASAPRAEIQAQTDVPRATLSRILADFRDRDIVERTGPDYDLTPLGERLVVELDRLLATLDRLRALQTLADGLPLADLGVDLFAVDDLTVTLPTHIDPMAPVGRAAEVVEAADSVRGFCYSLLHAPILAMTRDIVESGSRFEGVISAAVLDVVASDPELVEPLRELLATGQAEVFIYDAGIETQFIIADGAVLFLVNDADGTVQGTVETGVSGIQSWAEERFDRYRELAEPIDPDALSDVPAA